MSQPPEPTPAAESPPPRSFARRVLTWAALVIIFIIIFSRIPLEKVLAEFHRLSLSSALGLFGLCFIAVLGVALIDGTAMWSGFRALGVKLEWREIVLIRSAMMLLASVATLFGQAGLAAFVAGRHKVSAGRAAGMVMFLFALEIYGMVALATLFLPVWFFVSLWEKGGSFSRGELVSIPGAQTAGGAALALAGLWMGFILLVFLARRGVGQAFLEKLKLAPLAEPFREVRGKEFWKLFGLKTLLALWQAGFTIPAFMLYGERVPALNLLAFMPLAVLAGSIPITPARLGTTQAAWVLFFHQQVPAEALVALSLLLQFFLNICRWALGAAAWPFLEKRRGRPDFHKPRP